MIKKIPTTIYSVDESPWPFLVLTASLFSTLGAVLLLDSEPEVQFSMMGWFGFASKVVRKTVITRLGGYSGVLVNNFSSRPSDKIYSNVVYTPDNYNQASINMLKDLAEAYTQQDKAKIYAIWRIAMCNPDGMFSKNFGKLCNTINMMTNRYNEENLYDYNLEVTEKKFFEHHSIVVSDRSFSTTKVDQFNSMIETAKMEIANRKGQGLIEYQRNSFEHQMESIANLGLQANNDCIVILKYDRNTGGFHLGYVDCKKLDELSFKQKLDGFKNDGFSIKPLEGTRAVFGCNLYLIAKDGREIFLDSNEKVAVLNFIDIMARENPNYFKDYQNSQEYQEFEKTGNLAVLSTSIYPFPKAIVSRDFQKYLRFEPIDDQKIYSKYLVPEVSKQNINAKINIISIVEPQDDN